LYACMTLHRFINFLNCLAKGMLKLKNFIRAFALYILIKQRDLAYLSHNMIFYKKLRNRVNRIRKSLEKQFYLHKVECLKSDNPSKWWRNIKAVCKFNSKCNQNNSFEDLTFNDIPTDLPDVINNFLINITSGIPVIDTIKLDEIRRSCGPLPNDFIIKEHDVFLALIRLKLKKAIGPDCIPNRILKHFIYTCCSNLCDSKFIFPPRYCSRSVEDIKNNTFTQVFSC